MRCPGCGVELEWGYPKPEAAKELAGKRLGKMQEFPVELAGFEPATHCVI
jgi:hypothetical protein